MKSDETAKTENDEEHSRQKRRNSLLSFVNFFFVLALATSISMLLGFYSREGIWSGLEEIALYMAIGGGLLLAFVITRKLRQRSQMPHQQPRGRNVSSWRSPLAGHAVEYHGMYGVWYCNASQRRRDLSSIRDVLGFLCLP